MKAIYESSITTGMMSTILAKEKLQAKQSKDQQVKGLGAKVRTCIASEEPDKVVEYSTYDTRKSKVQRKFYFAVCKLWLTIHRLK